MSTFKRRSGYKRKSTAFTDYMGNVATMGFRSRRIRPRTFRNILWKDTLSQNHYRSIASESATHATAADNTLGTAFTYLPLMENIGTGNLGFWESGVQNPDENQSAPTFIGDVVLRGGVIKISIFNPSNTDSVGFKLFVVAFNKNPDLALFPSNLAVPRAWDPSCIADYARKVGKVIHTREGTIRVLSSSSVEYKCRIKKVDQAEYRVAGTPNTLVAGSQLGFVLLLYNLSTTSAISCIVNTSRNVSFSGDASPLA